MRRPTPLTPAQRRELDFSPPDADLLPARDAATVCNLRGCVAYIREKSGRGYWFYVEGCEGGELIGYRRSGGSWRPARLPLRLVDRYY